LLVALLFGFLELLHDADAYWAAGNKIGRAGQWLGAASVPALLAALGAGLTKLVKRGLPFWKVWLLIYWPAAAGFLLLGLASATRA